MTGKPRNWLKFRIIVIFAVFILIAIAISARAYQLHILKSEKLSQLAKKQRKRIIPLAPKRGVIYDRNREELALSIDVDSIYAVPPKVANIRKYAGKLSKILKMNEKKLRKRLDTDRSFIWIKRKVTQDQSKKVRNLKFDGIHFVKEARRFYPNREVAGNTIGFVGLDPEGLEGLELQYNDYLKGEAALSVIERDALGRIIFSHGSGQRHDLAGNDLVLTMDKSIQYIAEKELREAVVKAKAKSGIAIVMNPKNGEILAIAIHPQFNPNIFWKYTPSCWRNRAITDSFEPGSTFKAFLIAASLEGGAVSQNDIFFCENGSYSVFSNTIHDVHPHGWLNLKNVLKYSSNIGASKIGEKLGKKKYYEYIKKFGFGERTGIDLPGETAGSVRPPKNWSKIAIDTISFGQGISVTAIQLISALSVIANKGYLMKPYLVKQIVTPEGKVIKEFTSKTVRRVISEKTAGQVRSLLKTTVLRDGTGTMAYIDGYKVAGKTGTSQKADLSSGGYLKDMYIASFIGFVPADDPEIAILVVIDEPKGNYYGGQVAAPVFKKIAEKTLHYLGVLPTVVTAKSNSTPSKAPAQNRRMKISHTKKNKRDVQSGKLIMPDLTGMSMRQVLRAMHASKIDIRIVGSGRAVSQSINPGNLINAGEKCWIRFQQPS